MGCVGTFEICKIASAISDFQNDITPYAQRSGGSILRDIFSRSHANINAVRRLERRCKHAHAVVAEVAREACLWDRRARYNARAHTHTYCRVLVPSARPSPLGIKMIILRNWHRCVIRRMGGHIDCLVRCRWFSMKGVEESDEEHQPKFFSQPSAYWLWQPFPAVLSLKERNRYHPTNGVDTRAMVMLHSIRKRPNCMPWFEAEL